MAANRAQMEAEMMRFEQEISLPPAAPGYRPPLSFIPHQVMRQQQAPLLAARPANPYAYNNWNAVNAAAYGAHAHGQQPNVPQQVPTMYSQPPSAAMWSGQAALPVNDQSRNEPARDAKWKFATRTVISAPPSVISAPPAYNTQVQPIVAGPTQSESAKIFVAMPKTNSAVSTSAVKAASAKPSASASSSSKPGASTSKSSAASSSKPSAPPEDAAAASATATATGGSNKKILRTAAGKTWEDPTMADWDPSDFRIFVGDLGNEATDEMLARLFNGYASFQRARVVRDPRTNKVKGYGFVSFRDPKDFLRAMKEVNGRYCGNRPVKLSKSVWKDRSTASVRKREKEKMKLGLK